MNESTGKTFATREEALFAGVNPLHLVSYRTIVNSTVRKTVRRADVHADKAMRKLLARQAKRAGR